MSGANGTNGSGGHHDNDDDDDNIVRMPTLAERDKMRRETQKQARKIHNAQNPMINLPPTTKYLLGGIIAIHLAAVVVPGLDAFLVRHFAFFPAAFAGKMDFGLLTVFTPITHMFLHGGWLHIAMNGFMLAAFGTGVKRWIGPRAMILFFLACGVCGAFAHFAIGPASTIPVVGASGGLSGFFAAALVMMSRQSAGFGMPGANKQLFYAAAIFILISLAFSLMGGSNIAWAAHIGGFLGGFLMIKLMKL